jgi:hypothetical protein
MPLPSRRCDGHHKKALLSTEMLPKRFAKPAIAGLITVRPTVACQNTDSQLAASPTPAPAPRAATPPRRGTA